MVDEEELAYRIGNSTREIFEGEKITLFTNDPTHHPLPDGILLEINARWWHFIKLAGLLPTMARVEKKHEDYTKKAARNMRARTVRRSSGNHKEDGSGGDDGDDDDEDRPSKEVREPASTPGQGTNKMKDTEKAESRSQDAEDVSSSSGNNSGQNTRKTLGPGEEKGGVEIRSEHKDDHRRSRTADENGKDDFQTEEGGYAKGVKIQEQKAASENTDTAEEDDSEDEEAEEVQRVLASYKASHYNELYESWMEEERNIYSAS